MNDKSVTPKRLSSMQILVGTIVAATALGFAAGLVGDRVSEETEDLILGGGALLALTIGCVSMGPYWRRLDEAAREAHKDAWLWGGMVGYVIAALFAVLLTFVGGELSPIPLAEMEPGEVMALGIALTILLQGVCYGVAWGIWWARKR